jgi:antagonist of KipI
MSLRIIKAGILDSIQDEGRWRYQHLGINPGGVMDQFSSQVANILIGNFRNEPLIEMHFPAGSYLFEQDVLIAMGGANFSPTINGKEISLWQPIVVSKNSKLQFVKWKQGARCYLAIREKFELSPWLNSYSTNLKAVLGGYKGRAFQKDDVIDFAQRNDYKKFLAGKDHLSLPWKADTNWTTVNKIFVLPGNEWNWLSETSKREFFQRSFTISSSADRMGYRLNGKLDSVKNEELVSSGVNFGTIQLLPNGEMIILMADHQTTGGYPRIAHVITAHLPFLAQMRAGDKINFEFVDQKKAENLFSQQEQHLQQLENACKFKLQQFFS